MRPSTASSELSIEGSGVAYWRQFNLIARGLHYNLLASATPFGSYLHSANMTTNKTAVTAARSLFPRPPPFAFRLDSNFTSRRARARWNQGSDKRLLVNIQVAALSHVALSFPRSAIETGRVGAGLDPDQR